MSPPRRFPFRLALLLHLAPWAGAVAAVAWRWDALDALGLPGVAIVTLLLLAAGIFGLHLQLREDASLGGAPPGQLWRRFCAYTLQLGSFGALTALLLGGYVALRRPLVGAMSWLPDRLLEAAFGLLVFLLLGASALAALALGGSVRKLMGVRRGG